MESDEAVHVKMKRKAEFLCTALESRREVVAKCWKVTEIMRLQLQHKSEIYN